MRVLLVSQEMPPETGWGGIGTYVAALAPALAAAGAEVHVLSVVRGQTASDGRRDGVFVHRRPLRRPPGVGRVTRLPETWERITLAAAVDRELRALEFTPDVIEAPEWRAEGLLVALRRRAPVVVRLHSAAEQLFPFSGRAGRDARTAVRIERRSMLAADVLVSTPSNLAQFAQRLGADRLPTRAVYLPVPATEAPQDAPAAPRVAVMGRLEQCKGPETLVAAAPTLLEAVPQARISFIGADTGLPDGGSYRAQLVAQAQRLGVAHAVEFRGHLDHAAAMDELRRAQVCAFPARQETFGYGAAEAAAAGRAVVASRIPSFTALFGAGTGLDGPDGSDAAVLVDPQDAAGWGRAVAGLLRDPGAARTLAAAGHARVRERCAPERIAAEMLDVYAEAVDRAAGRLGRRPARRPRRRMRPSAPVS